MKNKLIIAHRGASGEAPENTLEAFQKAIDAGADMIETDIRKTKDNVLILHHDPDISGHIISKLYWQQVKELNPQIPTLEEALLLIAGKIKLDAELKEGGYEQQAVELLQKYLKPADFVITSFIESVLLEIKKTYPDLRAGLLLGNNNCGDWFKYFKYIFTRRKARLYDFWAPSFNFYRLGLAKFFPRLGYGILVWTVNEEKDIIKILKDKEVAGIISDDPKFAVKTRNSLN